MRYKEYGRTGVKVPVLGFGAMRLPGGRGDIDLPVSILRRAFDLGMTYVDTAAMYESGLNETIVGKAIAGRRDRLLVSTKNHYKGSSGDEWQRVLERSLERLGVETIDFYHLHSIRWSDYRRMSGRGKPLERFRKARDAGLIRHMCFSCHDSPKNIIKLIDTGQFEGMLVQYNLLNRKNEDAIAHAHEKGMGVAIMGPVGGGRLAAPSGWTKRSSQETERTPETALRFVLANPNVTMALSGMTTIQMVEENVITANWEEPLSAEERQGVLRVVERTRRLAALYCTGCGYCMPCPNDVDIPGNFSALNNLRVWEQEEGAREQYEHLREKGTWAEACIECGECEPKCPQQIPIRERLKQTAATLGTE